MVGFPLDSPLEVAMLCAKQPFFALLFVCHLVNCAAAQEKPFNQEEWQRKFDESQHPKPGDPRLKAIADAKFWKSDACVKSFIAKNATPTSDSDKLTEQACHACDKSLIAEGIADYNHKLTTMPLNDDKDESIKVSRDFCPFRFGNDAFYAVEDKQFEIKKAKEADLNAKYAAKVAPAMHCSTQAAKIYSLTTSDSAESVATASFEKCHDLWGEAAAFALNVFPNLSDFDRWDDLKKAWMDHGISAVIDERARQKLDASPPANSTAPVTKKDGAGI